MGRADYRKSTDTFKFYNLNPFKKKSAGDCVARAISGATSLNWEQVIRELTDYGIKLGYVFNMKETYDKWLCENGWRKNKQPRKPNNKKYTIKEFCKLQPKGIFIVGVANHLTFIEDGILYDTWNCEYKTVGNYWSK